MRIQDFIYYLEEKGMSLIAWGLKVGHPAAYLLIFMLIGIPLLFIIITVIQNLIDKIKEKKRR